MTRLSVNINKIATLRNARGGDEPSVVEAAVRCQEFGAEGITIHPRPDERHIRRRDVYDLKRVVHTEFNIEGYPSDEFINLVLDVVPTQVTLVPDPPEVLTSCAGWDVEKHQTFLRKVISTFRGAGIRTSIFVDPLPSMIPAVVETKTDRIELYTESYAREYPTNAEVAVDKFVQTAEAAHKAGIGINAGHDLSLSNIQFLISRIPYIEEVSIGHALISEALYLGLENTVRLYKERIYRGHLQHKDVT